MPIDGVAQAARFGGWRGYTVDALAGPLVAEHGAAAFALGMRLYLMAGLGRMSGESFSVQHLRRWAHRAARLLADHDARPERVGGARLSALAGRSPYVDPFRLVTTLLSRDAAVPKGELLDVVLGPPARTAILAAS